MQCTSIVSFTGMSILLYDCMYKHADTQCVSRDLHSRNILCVNRPRPEDLDPSASPVDRITSCVITDMGQSVLLEDLEEQMNAAAPLAAGGRCVWGSRPHLAPELYEGRPRSCASDVFAFGTLLRQIASRQPPYIIEDQMPDMNSFTVPRLYRDIQ
jgi:hypothetical protein